MLPTGKHFDVIRQQNLRLIHSHLRHSTSGTKAELAALSGLSFPTIGSLLAELMDKGEVISIACDPSSGGRPAERFKLNTNNTLLFTVFIENGQIFYRIYDAIHQVIDRGFAPSTHTDCVDDLIALLHAKLLVFPTIRMISLGLPCAIIDNQPFYLPEYPALENKNIMALITESTGLPVIIENDTNCMVMGYAMRHFEQENPDMIYVFNGSNGPGSGLLINGKMISGFSGFAGELGFIPFGADDTLCSLMKYENRDKNIDVLSRYVAIATALINPKYIAFTGVGIDEALCLAIHLASEKYVPKERLPICCYATDFQEDYYAGLIEIGLSTYLEHYAFKNEERK